MKRQEAEAQRDWYQARYSFPFIVEEWGSSYRVLAVRTCQRCGRQFNQGGGFEKPAICEDCDRLKRYHILEDSWRDGERRREENKRSLDFEEVCQ